MVPYFNNSSISPPVYRHSDTNSQAVNTYSNYISWNCSNTLVQFNWERD